MYSVNLGRLAVSALAATILFSAPGKAEPLAMNDPDNFFPGSIFQQMFSDPAAQAMPESDAAQYPRYQRQPQYQTQEALPEAGAALPENLRRQVVAYNGPEAPGTIIIDTPHTYLYLTLGQGRAMRYGIGVGRDGFTWSGVQSVARKQEWPDWHPPAEMIARQPYLPRMMSGGPGNPLGARAMYLGNTMYRIHGTNDPSTIGKHVSSGCIRLTNEDVIDLYNRVSVGAKVVVLPDNVYRAQRPAPAHATRASERRVSERQVSERDDAPRPIAAVPHAARSSLAYGSTASRLY